MDEYIKEFLNVIRNSSVENTYKMAWARSIVELCIDNPKRNEISLTEIAPRIFKYYWNQTFFFGMNQNFLSQSQNPNKPPEIVRYVKDKIGDFISTRKTKQIAIKQREKPHAPEFFEKVEDKIDIDIDFVVKILKQDVSWRFLKLRREEVRLYQYTKGDDLLFLKDAQVIADYSDVLVEAINYRWSQILESFNKSTPNICKKVRLQDDREIKRSSLTKGLFGCTRYH